LKFTEKNLTKNSVKPTTAPEPTFLLLISVIADSNPEKLKLFELVGGMKLLLEGQWASTLLSFEAVRFVGGWVDLLPVLRVRMDCNTGLIPGGFQGSQV
jgi:hypothetical protein